MGQRTPQLKGSAMKTYISNKQLSDLGYENKIINNLDKGRKPVKDGPFNTAMADALRKVLKLPEDRVTWNTLHLTKD